MTWDNEGILFGQGKDGILRVSAAGGTPRPVIVVRPGEIAHGPQVLPGGDALLFTVATEAGSAAWDNAQIVRAVTQVRRPKDACGGRGGRSLSATGHLVYAIGGVVVAVPFDVGRLAISGGAVPVIEGVGRSISLTGAAQFTTARQWHARLCPGATIGVVDTTGRGPDGWERHRSTPRSAGCAVRDAASIPRWNTVRGRHR